MNFKNISLTALIILGTGMMGCSKNDRPKSKDTNNTIVEKNTTLSKDKKPIDVGHINHPDERTLSILSEISNEHSNHKSTLTVAQLKTITPALENVEEANEKWYQSYIEGIDTNISAPTTIEEVQNMIDEVNGFNLPTNAILDRNFYKKTNGAFEHRFVYLPVINPKTGRTWLNNNLGAGYADTNSSDYNASQQATASDDYLAYGSLFQWGRKADGHELINWIDSENGYGRYGTTTTRSNSPSNSLFITETNYSLNWRINKDDTLWASESSPNNICPAGYRLPLNPNGSNDAANEWHQETKTWAAKNAIGALGSVLKLSQTGYRDKSTGTVIYKNIFADYWSGSVNGASVRNLSFSSAGANTLNSNNSRSRMYGMSVRCIKDQPSLANQIPSERTNNILLKISSEHINTKSTITVEQLQAITPTLDNIDKANEKWYQSYIEATDTHFSSPATREEIQSMIDEVNSFNIPTNAILDRNFYKKTNGKFEHRFVYLPVTNPNTGRTWLNNNLGAEYANVDSSAYNASYQATAIDDHLAYGSLFQWGRGADGHELINWISNTDGEGKYTTTTIKFDTPSDSLYITADDWRVNRDDTLWASKSSANNVCPTGYRLPLNPHGAEDSANDFYVESKTWGSQDNAGALSSELKLTAAGLRWVRGGMGYIGKEGMYWTGSIENAQYARDLWFGSNFVKANDFINSYRGRGFSVRCIKDQTPAERSESILLVIGNQHSSGKSAITIAQLKAITPALKNINDKYESSYRHYIVSTSTHFSSPATRDEVQSMIDTANLSLSHLTKLGSYNTAGESRDVTLSSDGSKAYVADDDKGLVIVDISDPYNPTKLSSYNTAGNAKAVALSSDGTKAYVADYSNGLVIVDISNPAHPTKLGSCDTAGELFDVTLSRDGTKAYVADYWNGLVIIDISDPAHPTKLGSYDTAGGANGVTLSSDGTKAYVADFTHGLVIVNISNPAHPTMLSSYNIPGNGYKVTLSGDGTKAYIAAGIEGLIIVDIRDPYNPTKLGSYNTDEYALDVTLSSDGTKAYVADYYKGLVIVDISSSTHPRKIESFDTAGDSWGVTLSSDNSNVYIADRDHGLIILGGLK